MSELTLNDYQQQAGWSAFYPGQGGADGLIYCTLGLCGEAGEFSEKVKKMIRDDEFDRELMLHELGDVLWYISQAASELDCSLAELGIMNLKKLRGRKEGGRLQGSGDER